PTEPCTSTNPCTTGAEPTGSNWLAELLPSFTSAMRFAGSTRAVTSTTPVAAGNGLTAFAASQVKLATAWPPASSVGTATRPISTLALAVVSKTRKLTSEAALAALPSLVPVAWIVTEVPTAGSAGAKPPARHTGQ